MTVQRKPTRVSAMLIAVVLTLLVGLLGAPSVSAAGGRVLPPGGRPHGYSLTDMTRALAFFTASGNLTKFYPDTPLQVLYTAEFNVHPDGTGLFVTGTNSFVVMPGTTFFVPIQNATDSPPVAGVFPTTNGQAKRYFFDSSQLGGRDYEIVVDGRSTSVGSAYVAGPVTTAPLPDGGGTHIITLGVFLSPLSPGTHTVTIRGGLFGDAIAATYPFAFLREEFTYTVEVVPRGR
jgi:hypothetical protein